MIDTQNFHVELVEKDLVNIELVEKDLVDVKLKTIDIIHTIPARVDNEVPTKLTVRKFQTLKSYKSETLKVYFNGIKEKYIIENSSNTFSFEIDTINEDDIEVEYEIL